MLFKIDGEENVNKVKILLERNNIEYEMDPYPFTFMIRNDIEYILENIDEDEDLENLTEYEIKEITKYIEEYMWNSYEWSDYNDFLMYLRNKKLKELRGE